jgi:hypothetical protein
VDWLLSLDYEVWSADVAGGDEAFDVTSSDARTLKPKGAP